MMTRCRVRVFNGRDYKFFVRRAARAAVKNERLPYPCLLEAALVSDEEMREINRIQRGIDKVTDVLSFPLRNAGDNPDPDTGRVYIGDILIAEVQAQLQAKEYGHSFERELAYLAAHGALHLLGYDHETEWDRAVMRKKEEAVMEKMGLLR